MIDLRGKVALITGSSSGIGRATARVLAGQGATVVLNAIEDPRSPGALEEAVEEIKALGGRALGYLADVADPAQVREMAEKAIAEMGKVDILVNNAGHPGQPSEIEKMPLEEWQRMLSVHLTGAFNCCHALVGQMKKLGWGRIINISSIWGMCGEPQYVHYSAAKAGLMGFTKALAKELAPYNITVNAVAPGATKTPLQDLIDPAVLESLRQTIPLRRFAQPEEMGYLIAFLCSDEGGYVTGQVISSNGGSHIVGI